jgi:hypothetical protein
VTWTVSKFPIRIRRFFCSALLASLAIGCFAQPINNSKALYLVVQGGDLIFDGQINSENFGAVVKAAAASKTPLRRLVITSTGGDARDALAFAEFVQKSHLDVVVRDYCNSGCAQYVFVAGKRKIVEPGALVAFHGTPSAMEDAFRRSPIKEGAIEFRRYAAAEQRFYRRLAIDKKLLLMSESALQTICVTRTSGKVATPTDRYAIARKFVVYVPSLQMMNKLGVYGIEGQWPNSQNELNGIVKALPFNDKFLVRFVDDKPEGANIHTKDAERQLDKCENMGIYM